MRRVQNQLVVVIGIIVIVVDIAVSVVVLDVKRLLRPGGDDKG